MNEKFILSLDIGTTRVTASVIDHAGNKLISSSKEISQYSSKPNSVEQDANEIWQNLMSAITNILILGKLKPKQIAGIGISNQRETTVIWDKNTGIPIYNALAWESRQTENYTKSLIDKGYSEFFYSKTGLRINPYFSATKILWLLDNLDENREKSKAGNLLFGTIDSWIVWNLSGGNLHITDYTNASRTMLYNIRELKWDQEILNLLDIPKDILPAVKSNSEIYGYTDESVFFNSSIPICGIAGDQQAALIGQLATEKGSIAGTYGTGAFIIMNTGNEFKLIDDKLVTTICYGINGEINYGLEGSIFVAGSALKWLQKDLKVINSIKDADSVTISSTSDHSMYVVPALTGLGAPYWDSEVEAASFGMTSKTTNLDFARATIDAVTYQTKDIIDLMQKYSDNRIKEFKVSGEFTKSDYWRRFTADMLNTNLATFKNSDYDTFGAAFLAGLAVGFWKDFNEIKTLFNQVSVTVPNMHKDERNNLYSGWKKAVKATISFKN